MGDGGNDTGFRGLKLTNTMSRTKEEFRPLDWQDGSIARADKHVRMYVCGPTVYDFAHIGNARPVIVFDVLYRLLRHLYGEDHVVYVRNITDVDDKINGRAARDFPDLPLNEAIRQVTETTANQFHADVAALGCLAPTYEPRATDFVTRAFENVLEVEAQRQPAEYRDREEDRAAPLPLEDEEADDGRREERDDRRPAQGRHVLAGLLPERRPAAGLGDAVVQVDGDDLVDPVVERLGLALPHLAREAEKGPPAGERQCQGDRRHPALACEEAHCRNDGAPRATVGLGRASSGMLWRWVARHRRSRRQAA